MLVTPQKVAKFGQKPHQIARPAGIAFDAVMDGVLSNQARFGLQHEESASDSERRAGWVSDLFFVDWLSLKQAHAVPLPVVSSGVVWAADEHGQLKWKTIKALKHEGSFETSVQVRCDGSTVHFSGNVSRFCRADNLFGYSLTRCIDIVNEILAFFSLPPFTLGRKYYRTVKTAGSARLAPAWTGASITRIDLTANFETGSLSNARAYLEWLAAQQGSARVKVGTHGDGETVDWGQGSRAVYAKCYLKSEELRRHGSENYQLIDHCEAVGLVRFEVTVKATWLHNAGCNYLGGLDMAQLEMLFEDRKKVLTRAEHTHDELETLPRPIRCTARDYLAGDDITRNNSERTLRRHRAALLPYGIDIAVKRNVINFKPRIRVIEVRPASVPSWYDFERKAA